jgi:hypothetical protein
MESQIMSDTIFSVLIEEFKKNGVKVKAHYFEYDNLWKNQTDLICESSDTKILDFTEHDKVFEDKIAELENIINHKLGNWDKLGITYQEILYMKAENDLLKQRIAELESKETSELPFDPLDTANYLINATYERETNEFERGFENLPEKVNSDRYTVDELEQIAEHLLIYCRHNKE